MSETGDPTGSYYAYSYTFTQFPDYPKFSIWWDGYYMTSNSNRTAVVFERDQMLLGNPNARMVALTAPSVINSGFTSVLPADADGDLPPAGTPCYFFNIEDNSWGAPSDRIKIYEMSTNWSNTSSTSVTQSQTLNTAAFDPWLGSGWNNIPQPGTTQKLDAGLGIFYYRAQHTRWADHNSVVLCHGVDVGSNHCAIRWYELRDANDGNWSIYQQGTWNPDGADRFYGSIAMDMNGNIGLGYSCADDVNDVYVGLRYTGRYADDPLGQMTLVEQSVIAGTSSQEGTNRFGDYAHMSLDPDGQTFWCTAEYIGSGGNPRTRVYSFSLAGSVGEEEVVSTAPGFNLNASFVDDRIQVSVTGMASAATASLEVIGLDGRQVLREELDARAGDVSRSLDGASLAAGVWFVRVVNGTQQKVKRIVKPLAQR
ncbi:MAG: T9SS type A sorting domain-containing protein [Flavobacteriales bacterium]|nr:T9SS type A sorting domain-containing protein [Flavobacteriales bacterium]